MATIISLNEILTIVKEVDVVSAMETGFKEYSNGNTIVPPVAELLFENPKGETHIKYGYVKNDEFFVIKIASGFYDNPQLGLSSSQGLMILLNQKTGQTVAVLMDDGNLTNIRTAAAGALAAKYFAPKNINAVGIIGAGIQAKLQLEYLQINNPCKLVWVWDINKENANKYKNKLGNDFDIRIAENTSQVAQNCNLIYTTTPSQNPLLKAKDIKPGTQIIGVGSDTPEKQELDSEILAKADFVISDSIPQSKSRGEIFRAVKDGVITHDKVIELGTAIQNEKYHRSSDTQIGVVDLTGVAVQDIMIAKEVYIKYNEGV